MVAWLKGDRYDAATGTWEDASGRGNQVTQGTVGARPAATTIASVAALSFDGGDSLDLAHYTGGALANSSIFVACEWPASAASYHVLVDGHSGGRNVLFQETNNRLTCDAGAAMYPGVGSATAAGARCVCVGQFAGASTYLAVRANGAAVVSTDPVAANPGTQAMDGLVVGQAFNSGGSYVGKIGEVIIYDRILSATERSSVVSYLCAKFSVVTL